MLSIEILCLSNKINDAERKLNKITCLLHKQIKKVAEYPLKKFRRHLTWI